MTATPSKPQAKRGPRAKPKGGSSTKPVASAPAPAESASAKSKASSTPVKPTHAPEPKHATPRTKNVTKAAKAATPKSVAKAKKAYEVTTTNPTVAAAAGMRLKDEKKKIVLKGTAGIQASGSLDGTVWLRSGRFKNLMQVNEFIIRHGGKWDNTFGKITHILTSEPVKETVNLFRGWEKHKIFVGRPHAWEPADSDLPDILDRSKRMTAKWLQVQNGQEEDVAVMQEFLPPPANSTWVSARSRMVTCNNERRERDRVVNARYRLKRMAEQKNGPADDGAAKKEGEAKKAAEPYSGRGRPTSLSSGAYGAISYMVELASSAISGAYGAAQSIGDRWGANK
eukprot:GFYU01018902.1.p1 GENE.GFYU01018902.1~~GFYU01018902.1.p1  ORF type:complete len:340 (+),score=73.92 GFYU01018902.1:106-1125(+)